MAVHTKSHQHFNRTVADVYDDCFYYTVECWDGGIRQKKDGTYGNVTDAGATETTSGHWGVLECKTGTNSGLGGRAGLGNDSLDTIQLGGGTIKFGCVSKADQSGAAGNNAFLIFMGLLDSSGSGPNGIYFFQYPSDANPPNIGSYWGLGAKNGANISEYSTGIASTANTWHTFEFSINAAGNSIIYYVDGVQVGVIGSGYVSGTGTSSTTAIPTGKLGLFPINIYKNDGNTSKSAFIDAYWYQIDFTSNR